MKNPHASVSYHELSNDDLNTFAGGIVAGFYANNPPFMVQPVTLLVFQALIADYNIKLTAYQNGGETQKGPFLVVRTALIDALDLIAEETDNVADGNSDTIILAGFEPTKERGVTVKPGQGTVTVERGIAGELIPTCSQVEGARHYGCIMTEGAPLPDWILIYGNGRIVVELDQLYPPTPTPIKPVSVQFDLTDQRTKHFLNLKHDVTYYFYFYVVNAKGVGPMSEVVSMVCW